MKKTFQMKKIRYDTNDVLESVLKLINRHEQAEIDNEATKTFERRKIAVLKRTPNWKKFCEIESEFLKISGIDEQKMKEDLIAEIIQEAFQRVINRRVRTFRTISTSRLSKITKDLLEQNLNIIRNVRKHEVGMKYRRNFR